MPHQVMNMPLKIGSLYLCLGFPHKKRLMKQIIMNNKIDLLSLQETELDVNVDPNVTSFQNFNFKSEMLQSKNSFAKGS
jgi:uncharacterized pyridoxamine 5'-phosphate oxidase family protein